MGKNNFQEYICRPYCFFFKDGEKEEMVCRGAEVLDSLVKRKQIDIVTIPPLIKKPGLWTKYKETLGDCLCSYCSFRAADCDFQSEAPSDDMEPCGGFILLAHLRANGVIQESDLE